MILNVGFAEHVAMIRRMLMETALHHLMTLKMTLHVVMFVIRMMIVIPFPMILTIVL